MKKFNLNQQEYADLARAAAAEACVLLKNDNQALPIKEGEEVAVFGRIGFDYYKSGLGSGGLVNTEYVVGILEALQASEKIRVNQKLIDRYQDWRKENPFERGKGWGKVPWSQKEMPVTDEMLDLAASSDIALIIIGRTAGEDQDNTATPGSYQLTAIEQELIEKVCRRFDRVAVLLNTGNIMDMRWVEQYQPQAVMYVWQGGQEGGNGVLDVLTGAVSPSGKLTDTIANAIEDYPSTVNFGDPLKNYYQEDIYVGYRYFETFAPAKVLYPFGYGLSYTEFLIFEAEAVITEKEMVVTAMVKNIGAVAGKQVLQVYVQAPQGQLGKADRVLIGYQKTDLLQPNQEIKVACQIPWENLASYDDMGRTGYKNAFVLEAGQYRFYMGSDVRSADWFFDWELKQNKRIERLEQALAPTEAFDRMRPVLENGKYRVGYQPTPIRTIDLEQRKTAGMPAEVEYTGDQGILLGDVFEGKAELERFVAQLTDQDMIHLFRGEGMCSPKGTPGIASVFGGVTERLGELGIPIVGCADGPSGIRMDNGTLAFSLPNGTALGCTFNEELIERLFRMLGMEMRKNKIDTLLGPGMNIHRNPLNGRNFEYISEDPLVTGLIGTAQCKGLADANVFATIKHFVANNQEVGRTTVDCVISERALREIYLRGFELAVKKGGAQSIMTTYGAVNGLWTAGSYDLCTTILRQQWGFTGIVMTDWWAVANDENESPFEANKAPMIMAQNDLFMVVPDSKAHSEKDNVEQQLKAGRINRAQLQRNSSNILSFILKTPAMQHQLKRVDEEELAAMTAASRFEYKETEAMPIKFSEQKAEMATEQFKIIQGQSIILKLENQTAGEYSLRLTLSSELGPLVQLPISVFVDQRFVGTISMNGTEGAIITKTWQLGQLERIEDGKPFIRLFFGADGVQMKKVELEKIR